MKIKKNSEAYKRGIRYSPNVDTLATNAEKVALGIHPCSCLEPVRDDHNYDDLSYKSYRSNDKKFNWWDLANKKLPPGTIEPIDKKFEW